MTTWSTLPRPARIECLVYGLLVLAGFVGTQVALVAIIRDGEVMATVWRDLTSTPTGVFVTIDLVVVFLAAMLFMALDGRRIGVPRWPLYLVLSCLVAISVGLPAYLLARTLHLNGADTLRA